jgi:hypothetical protein
MLLPWVRATGRTDHRCFDEAQARLTHQQLSFLYLLAFLDRTNIGNAKIAGLSKDLGLSVSRYNATLTIFFVSYAVFEPLTNILLKRLRPSIFLPIIM